MNDILRKPVAWRGEMRSPEERFLVKVDRDGGPESCWKWHGNRFKFGYGSFKLNNKSILAHRIAWELENGSIPQGLDILHECDFPACVNPRHLRIGTHTDNMRDAVERGRLRGNPGIENFFAKLEADDVLAIRASYQSGFSQSQIAKKFGIRQTNVSMIVTRQTWKHL